MNHVVVAPQEDGSNVYVVFLRTTYGTFLSGPGISRGWFELLDDKGNSIVPFETANSLDEDGVLFEYDGRGHLALGFTIQYGDHDWAAQVLHIVPVTPAQKPALSVILGPGRYGEDYKWKPQWTWKLSADGNEAPSIQIGPVDACSISRMGEPAAMFKWGGPTAGYVGPAGSFAEWFVRTQPPMYPQLERFIPATRTQTYTPPTCGAMINISIE